MQEPGFKANGADCPRSASNHRNSSIAHANEQAIPPGENSLKSLEGLPCNFFVTPITINGFQCWGGTPFG
jgi:hypothetical protein